MENYRLLQRLGKGSQGSVYLAEHRIIGQKFVLKKVECIDESEANKAFKEALALKELQHPYICGYREFFVTWEKEESTMYVCIVMDYYQQGDLGQFLRQRHEKNDSVDETTVKKWLGQIIEAMLFVHKKRIIHRDLKPSNIFLTEDMSICIGDFGVATIMSDLRTKTRTTVGSMNWMAPEVLDRPYDERSDVWSVGCVLLDITLCELYNTADMSGKLIEVKHNSAVLEELLSQVAKKYSSDLVSVMRTMLQRNYETRPTAQNLAEVPYIKECLAISGSVLAQRTKKPDAAPTGGKMPTNKGLEAVIDYLGQNLGNEGCVRQALEYSTQLARLEGATLDTTGKQLIIRAMNDFMSESDIQTLGCRLLSALAITASSEDFLYSNEVISTISLAMKTHRSSLDVQQGAAALLVALSADEGASEQIGLEGGLQDLLTAMRNFPDSAELCTTCCNALWSLAINEDNSRILTEEQGVNDVIAAVERHFKFPELIEAACAALFSLSVEEENLGALSSVGVVPLLIRILEYHSKEAKVVKNCCMTLATMAEADEESAYRILNDTVAGEEKPGIPIIANLYKLHRDNAEVIESLCSLIMELSEYDEIRAEFKFLKIGENVLSEIQKRFKENKDIIVPCEAVLVKLGLKKPGKNIQQI